MNMNFIEHIGIAVKSLDSSIPTFEKMLGVTCYAIEEVKDQYVKTAFFLVGETKIELLESTNPDGPIGKFISNKGEGVHHDITDHRLTSSSSFTPKSKKSITPSQANRLAEDYIDDNGVLHGTMGLDFYQNLSDPDNGIFTFYGSVCYGSSKDNCQYDNVYISTKDNGDSWSVSF